MNRKHQKTLASIFVRPISANIHWREIESMLISLGAEITQREGSRIAVFLFGEVRIFHRPHPGPNTDKGAISSIRKWLEGNGVKP